MQKKLLSLFIAVNCVMVQANELPNTSSHQNEDVEFKEKVKALFEKRSGKKEDIFAAYEKELSTIYQGALARELAGNENAINNQSDSNKQANKQDEDNKKKYFDDSQHGSLCWLTSATESSIKGYMAAEWAGIRKEKDAKNAEQLKDHLKKCNDYKKIVKETVMPVLEQEITRINYEMEETFYRGLEQCGTDKECLLGRNVHWPLQEEFLDRLITAAVDPVIKVVKENNIPLTDHEVMMIARKKVFLSGTRQLSLASAEETKRKVMAKLDDLLHPKQDGAGDDRQD